MPRRAARSSVEDLILQAVEAVANRTSAAIARAVADLTAARIDEQVRAEVARAARRRGRGGRRAGRAARARTDISRWAADRRARRVPNFVIEQTGLKTKKQIVAKFGDGATFEKGKPLPKAK
ncbi:MAG TPA: hypothetical protein VMT17_01340 [Anaeromyxobacteraceae bacterium]|nr:hypothetical protein [Anaeromyxobacteraceae bacterium]